MKTKEKIEKSNAELTKKFCPIIKSLCLENCISFECAQISESGRWIDAYCSNVLIDGYISTDN